MPPKQKNSQTPRRLGPKHENASVAQPSRSQSSPQAKNLNSSSFFPSCCGNRSLRNADQLPSWQKSRPHIISGYRVGYSPIQAILSLFQLHNETGNVLSHFIPFWIVVACTIHLYAYVIESMWHHKAIFFVFILANFMVFFFSTLYHLMSCVSHRFYETTMFLDYFSISALLVGSFVPSIYFAFACHFWERLFYLTLISILGSVSLALPWFNFFDSPEFTKYRIGLFTLTGASGVLPAIHSAIVFPIDFAGGINPSSVIHCGVSLMFLFYALGIIFYVSRFPEAMFPGKFDLSLFFQSHTLWHIMVAAAAICHFFTCVGVYQRFNSLSEECPA